MTGAKILAIDAGVPEISGAILLSPRQRTLWRGPHLKADRPPETGDFHGGLHAYHDLRAAVATRSISGQSSDVPDASVSAYAIVRPDGETIIGEHGWTAAGATICRIYLPAAIYAEYARDLYERYRVPVHPLPRSLTRPRAPQKQQYPAPGQSETGKAWLALYRPGLEPRRWGLGRLALVDPRHAFGYRSSAPAPLILYDAAYAAQQDALDALRREREARERDEAGEREARERRDDQALALEILRPYLPIPSVRVSSARARGAANHYPYWGVARYQIRATADKSGVANMVVSGASSDRRSLRLAHLDAEAVAKSEGRIVCQTIGMLSAAEAHEIAAKMAARMA